MKQLTVLIFAIITAGCSGSSTSDAGRLETVEAVDIKQYAGKWYEIASFPFYWQDGCSCTTAEYEILEQGVIKVTNTCIKEGDIDQSVGKAFVVEGSNNAKLQVQFFWPFKGDYWVIDLSPDYSYAVVGVPNRKYCWILSRTTTMSEETYTTIVQRMKGKGFDVSKFNKTVQDCK